MQIKLQKILKKIFSIGLVFGLVFIQSCGNRMRAIYDYTLENVESPSKTSFKKNKIFSINSFKENEPLVFEDNFIKIEWTPTESRFYFKLENKTNETIRLIWNKGSFVDTNNSNYRIINRNIDLSFDTIETPPTNILKKTFLNDFVYPFELASYSKNNWYSDDLLKIFFTTGDSEEKKQEIKDNINSKFLNKYTKILIPIEIKGEIKEYIFYFKIENISFSKYR